MKVSVVFATPARQFVRQVELADGATVRDAVFLSGLLEQFPELKPDSEGRWGVFGRVCEAETPLKEGDQVEIYRPLLLSPMEARRMRARKKTRK